MLFPPGRIVVLAALVLLMALAAPSGFAQNESEPADVVADEVGDDPAIDSEIIEGDSEALVDTDHPEGTDHPEDPAHPDDEHAGHDPPGTPPLLSIDVGSAVANIAIFLGVFAILAKFVWPTILGGLQAREEKIHGDLEAAEKANQDARKLLADYQSKLDQSAGEVQAMLAEARQDAEANKQRIVEEAKAEADRQRERALADIETAKKVALAELAGQTSDMAIQVAKQVVGRELRAEDHADLIRQALDRLPSNN